MNKLLSILCLLFLCVSCTSVEIAANLGKKILPEDFKNKGFQKPVYKIGDRYEIGGVSYLPKKNLNYNETGIASWYGPNFHGKLTANGEIFNQYEMTAAHKTLPMPSVVQVINLDNGLSTVVRINDRGPFVNDRIIDLSYAAAKKLKLDQKGTVEVRVVLLKSESIYLEKLAKKGEFPEIKDLKNFSTPPIIKPNLSDVNIQSIGNKKIKSADIKTAPYPGFPTDLQAQIMVLLCKANKSSTLKEDIFENRFMHVAELNRMGAKISTSGNKAFITGNINFAPAELMATDLRASVSLILAALTAKGKSVINRIYHLDRGYENIEKKLKKVGAKIRRIN